MFKRYKFLLGQLVARDFKVKYKRSVLGVLWSVLNPLFTMIILSLVFSSIFHLENSPDVVDYSAFLLIGIVLWNYFAEATSIGMGGIVYNFGLLTKVYIPKYIFPISKVLSSALNMLFALIPMYIIAVVKIRHFYWVNIFLPYDLICLIGFASGLALLLSALTVFFRDMFYIHNVITTAWMYLTPVMYSVTQIAHGHVWYVRYLVIVMKINPMYQYLTFARTIILSGRIPTLFQFVTVAVYAAVMLIIGGLFFRSKQDKFIYYI